MYLYSIILMWVMWVFARMCVFFALQYKIPSFILNKTNKYAKCDQQEKRLCLENKDLTVIRLPFCVFFVPYVMLKSDGT